MDESLFPDDALAALREARYDPEASRAFELLSASFYWSDEAIWPVVHRICRDWGSRACFNVMVFRSSLIRGRPKEDCRPAWDQLLSACPEWPGFRPERSSPALARALDRALRRQCIAFERELRDIERETEA